MDMMKLMKQAHKLKKVQKELSNTVISDTYNGVALTITGSGAVKKLEISEELFDKGIKEVEKSVKQVIHNCLKKQQDMQKETAKAAMGGLKLPDIFG